MSRRRRFLTLLPAASLLLCAAALALWAWTWHNWESAFYTRPADGPGTGWEVAASGRFGRLEVSLRVEQTLDPAGWDAVPVPRFGGRHGWEHRHEPVGGRTPVAEDVLRASVARLGGVYAAGFAAFGTDATRRVVAYPAPPGPTPLIRSRQWVALVPLWVVAAAAAVAPAAAGWRLWRRARQSRRARAGLCPDCGYDLRASAGRCPECGAEPTAAAAPAAAGKGAP